MHVYPHSGYLPTELLPTARTRIMVAVRVTMTTRWSALRCFSDVGRRAIRYAELRENFKKRYPIDEPPADYMENDLLAIDGGDNRLCKVACVAFRPLGERRMPDVVRRVKDFASVVPPVELKEFPPGR